MHEQVLGVVRDDGRAVAFPVEAASRVLADGGEVSLDGVVVDTDGAGLVARVDDADVASHQAFWFAWSQFHPDTSLWLPTS